MEVKYSVIIPVIINDQSFVDMTLGCLRTLAESVDTRETEIIVVDNGSKMKPYFGPHITITNKSNIGYGPALNQGIKLSHGKYILCSNNDVTFKKGFLVPLTEELEKDPMIGVIRPVNVGGGVYGSEKRKFGMDEVAYDKKDYHGFCFLMKRETFDTVGLFDEQFAPAYCEDMDMWARVDKAGLKLVKHYGSEIHHAGGVTASALADSETLGENRKKFFKKHGFDVFSEDWYTDWEALQDRFGKVE